MIACPRCQKMLPDWSQSCQFCGAPLANVPRPKGEVKKTYGRTAPNYVWVLYYIFAALWIIDGARILLVSLGALPKLAAMGSVGQAFSGMMAIATLIGAALVGLGVGLILKWEPARGVANVICFLNILGGLFNLVSAIFLSPLGGVSGIFNVFLAMFSIAWTGAQIWVIGETD